MTLAQLQSFVLVARLGSVKAAAAELEVTEPAVSVAVAALRRELGDELFVRNGRGIALTPGGRRLAALGERDPRPRRAGPALGSGGPRAAPPAPGGRDQHRGRAHRPADRRVQQPRLRPRDHRRAGPWRVVRRPARAPPRRHRAGAAPRPGPLGDDRLGAVSALAADDCGRARAPAGRAARDLAVGAGRRTLAGRTRRTPTRRRPPGCSSPAMGSNPRTSPHTPVTPPRSQPRPRARA